MKNAILTFSIALALLSGSAASAQILTENGRDTAIANSGNRTDFSITNRLKSGSANNMVLRWSVTNTNLGSVPGWETIGSGICDNALCQTADANVNPFTNGMSYYSQPYSNSAYGDFHVALTTNNPANGSSVFVRVYMLDTVSKTNRTLTFIGMKSSAGVVNINSTDDVVLYPNPARDAVNVIYDEKAGVKTIAVFNIIGKLMGPIYKPANNGSAQIALDDVPNGVYFLRLMNGQGQVVATRRFTRQ